MTPRVTHAIVGIALVVAGCGEPTTAVESNARPSTSVQAPTPTYNMNIDWATCRYVDGHTENSTNVGCKKSHGGQPIRYSDDADRNGPPTTTTSVAADRASSTTTPGPVAAPAAPTTTVPATTTTT